MKDIKQPDLEFTEVVGIIVKFMDPIWQGIVKEEEFFGEWDKNEGKWRKN